LKKFRIVTFSALFTHLLLGLLLSTVFATVFAQSIPEPQLVMEETSKRMVKAFMDKSEAISKDPQVAYDLITKYLLPKINFELMSRYVLGKNWKKAAPTQQQEFISQFRQLLLNFYSKALLKYLQTNDIHADIITFKPFRGKKNSRYATVRSIVNPPGGGTVIQVNYDLYQSKKSGLWQVYDLSVEGISLVTNYRSSFNESIAKNGMDGLINEIKDKVRSLKQSDKLVDKKV
jgi:phospholipid transport system substrate-binding protein